MQMMNAQFVHSPSLTSMSSEVRLCAVALSMKQPNGPTGTFARTLGPSQSVMKLKKVNCVSHPLSEHYKHLQLAISNVVGNTMADGQHVVTTWPKRSARMEGIY